MTAPALARGQTGRRYVWPPKTDKPELVVPSVTTITGTYSKPFLTGWAAKLTATYAVEQILNWQDLPTEGAVDLLKNEQWRVMKRARDLGTAVHEAIHLTLDNSDYPVELDLVPYVAAAFLFIDQHVDEILHSEATIFNRTYLYAGTADLIAVLKDGRTAICDWKTGNNIWPDVALQLCGYAHGEFIGTDDGQELEMPSLDVGIVVHLKPNASYVARETDLDGRAWKSFIACRTLQKWRDDYEADALGKTHKGKANA